MTYKELENILTDKLKGEKPFRGRQIIWNFHSIIENDVGIGQIESYLPKVDGQNLTYHYAYYCFDHKEFVPAITITYRCKGEGKNRVFDSFKVTFPTMPLDQLEEYCKELAQKRRKDEENEFEKQIQFVKKIGQEHNMSYKQVLERCKQISQRWYWEIYNVLKEEEK